VSAEVTEPTVSAAVSATVAIPEAPELVWRAAMDWERQGEWVLATRVALTGGNGRSVGSTVRAVTGLRGYGIADTFEIVEWTAPDDTGSADGGVRRCVVRHTGGVVRGLGIFEVVPNGAGDSRMTWAELLELPLGAAGRLGWPLVRPAVKAGLWLSLRRFARLVGGPPVSGPR
jgi:Polyketide cyclase / dehydrase and lipid transport